MIASYIIKQNANLKGIIYRKLFYKLQIWASLLGAKRLL